MAAVKDSITGLYITYFNRAPDEAGLDYWETQAAAHGATAALNGISAAFALNAVAVANYPGTLSNTAFVQQVYQYALNRGTQAGNIGPIDPAGQAYWEGRLAAGVSRSDMMVDFVNATLDYNSAADTTSSAAQKLAAIDAQAMMKNKITAGQFFATSAKSNVPLDANGNPDINSAQYLASRDVMNGITKDESTLTAAIETKVLPYHSSLPDAAYALFAYQTAANEGARAVFKLNTTNLDNGTTVAYTLSGTGITAADVNGGLSGNVVIANNTATIFVNLALDATTEGNETIRVAIPNQTLVPSSTPNTLIVDTSITGAAAQDSNDNVIQIIGTADMTNGMTL